VGRTVTDVTASEETANSPANSNAGKLLTKVPGRARPRTEALKEFEEGVVDLRCRMKPAFWPLLIPKAEDMFRWRAPLECGCVHEVLTPGKDTYPDHGSSTDPITGHRLLAGEYWCTADHGTAKPYRDIVEWVDRKVREFPPDPEEPEHGLDPETWEKIRHTEPHSSAFWRVKLSCGHLADSDVTDVEWSRRTGPSSSRRSGSQRYDATSMSTGPLKGRPAGWKKVPNATTSARCSTWAGHGPSPKRTATPALARGG
jgi:hypothetical protein